MNRSVKISVYHKWCRTVDPYINPSVTQCSPAQPMARDPKSIQVPGLKTREKITGICQSSHEKPMAENRSLFRYLPGCRFHFSKMFFRYVQILNLFPCRMKTMFEYSTITCLVRNHWSNVSITCGSCATFWAVPHVLFSECKSAFLEAWGIGMYGFLIPEVLGNRSTTLCWYGVLLCKAISFGSPENHNAVGPVLIQMANHCGPPFFSPERCGRRADTYCLHLLLIANLFLCYSHEFLVFPPLLLQNAAKVYVLWFMCCRLCNYQIISTWQRSRTCPLFVSAGNHTKSSANLDWRNNLTYQIILFQNRSFRF